MLRQNRNNAAEARSAESEGAIHSAGSKLITKLKPVAGQCHASCHVSGRMERLNQLLYKETAKLQIMSGLHTVKPNVQKKRSIDALC